MPDPNQSYHDYVDWLKDEADWQAEREGREDALITENAALEKENATLRALIATLADEGAAEVEGRYGTTKDHPALKRKYAADISIVEEARALLARTRAQSGGD